MPLVIQYCEPGSGNNRLVDAPAQIYVRQGTTVRFRAIMRPQTVPPTNMSQACWNNPQKTRGVEAVCTFNNRSSGAASHFANVVEVTVGHALGPVRASVKVIVYSVTPKIGPEVVTQTANRTHFGVDERINLNCEIQPLGVTAASVGGLRWGVRGSPGRKRQGIVQKTVSDPAAPAMDGTACYIAPFLTDDASEVVQDVDTKTVTLELSVASGPNNGYADTTSITIHRPTGVMTPVAGKDKHEGGEPSAGFLGNITFTPDDVSYSTLEFREASGSLTATGCFKGWAEGWKRPEHARLSGQEEKETSHTPTVIGGTGLPIKRENNKNAGVQDKVWTPYNPGSGAARHAGLDGTYVWKIYWQYRVREEFRGNESDSWVRFQIAEHRSVSDAAGRCVTTKAGGRAQFGLNAGSQNLNAW